MKNLMQKLVKVTLCLGVVSVSLIACDPIVVDDTIINLDKVDNKVVEKDSIDLSLVSEDTLKIDSTDVRENNNED